VRRALAVLLLLFIAASGQAASGFARALKVQVLRPAGGLPPHIVGLFEEPLSFQQVPGGPYYVFDRRAHTVYTVDADRGSARKLVEIGQEAGRIIQPSGFDVAPDGSSFVVADAPRAQERIQYFGPAGLPTGGFFLPGRPTPGVSLGNLVLNGVASLRHTGDTLLISHPEGGALFTEYASNGWALRSFGQLRPTGHERDRDLHVTLNAGLPLVDPTGGYFYVFMAGRPTFRKYDAKGALVFERHIEGIELDAWLEGLPTSWPTRRIQDREVPYVTPTVRAAAVDGAGRLWISLAVPYTYVYDAQGDKVRTVQFSAAGIISPTSLFFARSGRLLITPGCYEFDPRAQ
jgi:DNA-binding beta-propeller fold protein YncE